MRLRKNHLKPSGNHQGCAKGPKKRSSAHQERSLASRATRVQKPLRIRTVADFDLGELVSWQQNWTDS